MTQTVVRRIRWRRVITVAVLLMGCLSYVGWQMVMKRSVSIRLEAAGYDLTYTMAWGLGMQERISFSKTGNPFGGASGEWVELWKKPYNSGVSVYRTEDGSRYYLGTAYRPFIFEPNTAVLRSGCGADMSPAFTELGQKLDLYRSADVSRMLDPAGQELFGYIEPDEEAGAVPGSPPASRYYAGLRYLGRFGLVRASGRGDELRFIPAGARTEPRNSLGNLCG